MLAFLALSSRGIAAQDAAITYGTHIRIQAADERRVREGAFRSLTSDSISFSPGLDTAVQTLPMSRVRTIEVSRGMSSTGSAVKGGAIGVLLGAAVVAGMVYRCDHGGNELCGLGVALAAPVLVGGGLLAGVLVGRGSHKEKWSRVYPRDHDVSLLVGPSLRGGMSCGAQRLLRIGRFSLNHSLTPCDGGASCHSSPHASPKRGPSRRSAQPACERTPPARPAVPPRMAPPLARSSHHSS